MASKTDTGANKEQPQGREGWSKKSQERERAGPRRMKRRTGTCSARQKQAESEHSTRQKTMNSPQGTRATGTKATRPPTETERPGKQTPNLASHEVATGAVETKKNRPNRTRRQTRMQREDPGRPLANKETLRAGATECGAYTLNPRQRHDD